ncbi:MAG: carbohydrate-binding domain-containing protein [Bacteroidaceae bacterium]|nr:carbohydrate-binding domain-containing protein [Bacteroidaceae bacterium]
MRKTYLILSLLLFASIMQAQEQIRVWKEGESKRFTTSEIQFSEDGTTFSVADSTYDCATIDSITVVHTVTVTFDGDTAYVDLGHAANVTDTIKGAHVNIVSTNTKSELEFVLQGESTHGSLTYDGPLKCKFYLNGLNLKSDKGAAINIQCGKRVDLILKEGTENVLVDAPNGEQKAALYCKGHLEVSGSGSLTVSGNSKHAIATKEYMQLKKSTGNITVNKAVSDAMHIGQYFLMEGGTLDLSGQGGEGIQVETMMIITEDNDTIPNPEKEDNGLMFIRGGQLNITADAPTAKAIKAPTDLTISGGTFEIAASGPGTKGFSVSGNMLVNQDDNTTVITVRATGGSYEDESGDDSYCYGLKIKGNLTVTAGRLQVSNRGYGSKGGKVGGTCIKSPEASVSVSGLSWQTQ